MPELPEVETIVRDLHKILPGKILKEIIVIDPFVLRLPKTEFIKRLKNRTIKAVTRRGKAIIVTLDSGYSLIVQLMMTGQLVIGQAPTKHTHVAFKLSDNIELLYNDIRKFGQLRVIRDMHELNYFKILGPEPLEADFTTAYIADKLKKSARPVKNVLLDHTFVSGIGNIYACEILFLSYIDPRRHGKDLTVSEIKLLKKATTDVLNKAIKFRGSSMRDYRDASGAKGSFNTLVNVYGRTGKPCKRCKTPIERVVQAGRSTFYCRQCQK